MSLTVTSFQLADAHLQVMIEFADANDPAIRQQLLIIKVIDFLTQQIMYESLSDSEKAMNKIAKTSLLQTYVANNGDETLSDLDFGLDVDDVTLPLNNPPPILANLHLKFDEFEQQEKKADEPVDLTMK